MELNLKVLYFTEPSLNRQESNRVICFKHAVQRAFKDENIKTVILNEYNYEPDCVDCIDCED